MIFAIIPSISNFYLGCEIDQEGAESINQVTCLSYYLQFREFGFLCACCMIDRYFSETSHLNILHSVSLL
jgi:hypothetical protein